MYWGCETTSAIFGRFSSLSIHWLASSTARITALTVLGFLVANSSVKASTFSGWSFHICWVVMAVKPMPSAMARAFHGSPTQKPSILPTFMLATIWAGGMVMSETSRSGFIPPEASQYRIHIACVPGGYVMANVMGVPLAL